MMLFSDHSEPYQNQTASAVARCVSCCSQLAALLRLVAPAYYDDVAIPYTLYHQLQLVQRAAGQPIGTVGS